MSSIYVRDASTGKPLSKDPVQFLRVPERGEFIASRNQLWTVVRVIHDWADNGSPIALLDIAPPNSAGGRGGSAQPF